jgi:tellurite resistance protein
MAKKNSSAGLIIAALILFAILIKYWQVVLAIGAVVFIVWGLSRLLNSSGDTSTAQTQNKPSSNTIYVKTNHQTSSNSQVYLNDATIFGTSAQKSKDVSPEELWVPSGKTFQHAGYSICGGLVYFGKELKSIQRYGDEPSLINLSLLVDKSNPDREGRNMGYWPSYSQIQPTSRAAFLEWLANGKNDPLANIGYVFLYFYGLERRALADAKDSVAARNEIPIIIKEVKRLIDIYGNNHSFQGYASKFLDVLQASQVSEILYNSSPEIQSGLWEIPITLKIALGQMARDSVPLSDKWALAWADNDPNMPRRTAVKRCSKEFKELFKIRYVEKYGEGLKLKANKTKIRSIWYHPASSSFGGQVEIHISNNVSELPDITKITEPSSKIIDIINLCTDELESYSRYIGRNPDCKDSIEATSYLPQPLIKSLAGIEFQNTSSWLNRTINSDAPVSIPLSTVLQQFKSVNQESFGKKEATAIANLLGKMNVGIEPDPRFGSFVPKPGQSIVLFRIDKNTSNAPSAEFSAATIVLHLASAVAAADGSVDASEEQHLNEHLEKWLNLAPDEKSRLKAHTQWLLTSFPGMSGVKKRIEVLKQDQRESLGRFLVGVAQADGYIDPAEMNILMKIYDMLGLDRQSLYSHAHAAASEPVTVQSADFAKAQGRAIPKPPKKARSGISLDASSIEAKLAETVAVSAILNKIFTEDETISVQTTTSEITSSKTAIAGLDIESFRFMQILATKMIWEREELERLASDYSIMLDGTLDSINDASFDHFGGPFFEGNDPIEINTDYAKELAA